MFINDIFKKKQITEANVKKPQPYNEPGWTRKLSKQELDAIAGTKDFDKPSKDKKDKQKKQDVKEAGPFSYGAKKPRKGSVADLAAQKRKEQERGRQPIEPKDQMVGTAKVVKEFAPSGGGRWYSDDQLYEIIGEDWLEAFDVSGDQGNIDLRGERARSFLAQEAEAWLTDRGYRVNVLDVKDDGDELSWYIQGPLYRGLAEGTQVLKLNDYDQWSNKVDAQGAVKHVQKNRTFVVAQSWNGETIGEFDTRSNQGWVMSHSEPNLTDDTQSVKEQQPTDPVSRYDQTMRQPSTSDKPGTKYYVGSTEVTGQEFDTIKQQHMANRSAAELDLDDFAQQARQRLKPKVRESSAQEKLYKRHQELRKKSGLPDPEYYQELKKTYDMPHEERVKQTAELKKKYGVTNEDRERYIEELQRAGYEIVTEKRMTCPECGGAAYEDQMLAEKQDACYHKVKSRYKVWPSAYASGALVRCRKKGAKNWGNKSKK